ncbi:hypothetical protein ABTY98_05150 [Streptomyces sp. NPDC096040]|uniref:hypothetical protein n=1 Tax=Streptomyces sp. NPDC096040 TaxID=3155541 RepID=UPI00332723E9
MTTPPTEPGHDLLDAALAAQLGRPLLDRINRHLAAGQRAEEALACARAAVPAITRALAKLPATCRYHGVRIDPAGYGGWGHTACCDTGEPARYRQLAEEALRAFTDTSAESPDTHGGHVRTADIDETPPTCLMPPTSTDTLRTHPDTDTPDTADTGVRIEYRARVRRDQVHLAIAEAFDVISRETHQ